MKKAILIALLGIIVATNVYAQSKNNSKTFSDIEQIASLDVSKAQVKDMLGEPKEIRVVKGNTRWIYRNKTHYIVLEWDDNKTVLNKFSYSTKEAAQELDANFASKLEIEKTTVNGVIGHFGKPNELLVKGSDQRMIYKYSDRSLLLQFRKGLLEKHVLTRS